MSSGRIMVLLVASGTAVMVQINNQQLLKDKSNFLSWISRSITPHMEKFPHDS